MKFPSSGTKFAWCLRDAGYSCVARGQRSRECRRQAGERATRAGNGEEGEEESSFGCVPEKHSCPSCLGAMPRLDSSTASVGVGAGGVWERCASLQVCVRRGESKADQ